MLVTIKTTTPFDAMGFLCREAIGWDEPCMSWSPGGPGSLPPLAGMLPPGPLDDEECDMDCKKMLGEPARRLLLACYAQDKTAALRDRRQRLCSETQHCAGLPRVARACSCVGVAGRGAGDAGGEGVRGQLHAGGGARPADAQGHVRGPRDGRRRGLRVQAKPRRRRQGVRRGTQLPSHSCPCVLHESLAQPPSASAGLTKRVGGQETMCEVEGMTWERHPRLALTWRRLCSSVAHADLHGLLTWRVGWAGGLGISAEKTHHHDFRTYVCIRDWDVEEQLACNVKPGEFGCFRSETPSESDARAPSFESRAFSACAFGCAQAASFQRAVAAALFDEIHREFHWFGLNSELKILKPEVVMEAMLMERRMIAALPPVHEE
eukprot:3770613-Rhodomonas_salina.2